jgi:hypothetical protein
VELGRLHPRFAQGHEGLSSMSMKQMELFPALPLQIKPAIELPKPAKWVPHDAYCVGVRIIETGDQVSAPRILPPGIPR